MRLFRNDISFADLLGIGNENLVSFINVLFESAYKIIVKGLVQICHFVLCS